MTEVMGLLRPSPDNRASAAVRALAEHVPQAVHCGSERS